MNNSAVDFISTAQKSIGLPIATAKYAQNQSSNLRGAQSYFTDARDLKGGNFNERCSSINNGTLNTFASGLTIILI